MRRRFVILAEPGSGAVDLTKRLRADPRIKNIDVEDIYGISDVSSEIAEITNKAQVLSVKQQPAEVTNSSLLEEIDKRTRASSGESQPGVLGITIDPRQLEKHCLSVTRLLRYLQIDSIIVLYKETHIASEGTGGEVSETPRNAETKLWNAVFSEWPMEVSPLFMTYEELTADPERTLNVALDYLRLERPTAKDVDFLPFSIPSKPPSSPSSKQISNSQLDLPQLYNDAIKTRFQSFPIDISEMVPSREPRPPSQGITYRVAEPYMSPRGREHVLDALDAGCISSAGIWPQKMAAVLKELYNVPVAHPCCNGFASLVLALQCAHVGRDAEVIVPSFTMVAVPNAVSFAGATPVFVDNSPLDGGYNPSWAEIERVATARTKALIVAHTYGVPVGDMEVLVRSCRLRGWVLIEDISECVGVRTVEGRLLGTFGDYACASLYANKVVHGADAGFVLSKHPEDASRLTSICNHGFTKGYHFLHFEIAPNFKVNGFGAAMAAGCLEELPMIMEHRSWLCAEYRAALEDLPVELMPVCGRGDTPWVFGLHCHSKEQRTALRQHMMDHGIETRDYFFPLHLQPNYQHLCEDRTQLPVSEQLSQTGFYIPTHTNLKEADVRYISQVIRSFYRPMEKVATPPKKNPIEFVRVNPVSMETTVRRFSGNGELISETGDHLMKEILLLRAELDQWLHSSLKCDQTQVLVEKAQKLIPSMDKFHEPKQVFQAFLEYANIMTNDSQLSNGGLDKKLTSSSLMDKNKSILIDLLKRQTSNGQNDATAVVSSLSKSGPVINTQTKATKTHAWDRRHIGININSNIDDESLKRLAERHVSLVRILVMPSQRKSEAQSDDFDSMPYFSLTKLHSLVDRLFANRISSVITLHDQIESVEGWQTVSTEFASHPAVIGYDLGSGARTASIHKEEANETDSKNKSTQEQLSTAIEDKYLQYLQTIRGVDGNTAIILPLLVYSGVGLRDSMGNNTFEKENNLLISLKLPQHHMGTNGNEAQCGDCETASNDKEGSIQCIREAAKLAKQSRRKLFIGEVGVSKKTDGANKYLQATLAVCRQLEVSVCCGEIDSSGEDDTVAADENNSLSGVWDIVKTFM